MNIEEFAKKYLNLELESYQLKWLKQVHEKKHIVIAPRRGGKRYDLIVIDDIEKEKKKQ